VPVHRQRRWERFGERMLPDLDPRELRDARDRCGDRLNTAWKYLPGRTLNVHFACDSSRSCTFPPSEQILSKASSSRQFQFVGSTYEVTSYDEDLLRDVGSTSCDWRKHFGSRDTGVSAVSIWSSHPMALATLST